MPIIRVLAADVPADVDMLIEKYRLPAQNTFEGRVNALSFIARMYKEKALQDFRTIHPDKDFFTDFAEEQQNMQVDNQSYDKVTQFYKVPPTFFSAFDGNGNQVKFKMERNSNCAGCSNCGGSSSMSGENELKLPKATANGFVVGGMLAVIATLTGVLIATAD